MQRALERGLSPLVTVLPMCLFGGAVLIDLGALVSGFRLFGEISYWVVGSAWLLGLVAATALLVDFITAPVGSVARRVRGMAAASTTGVAVAFTLAWYLRVAGGHAPTPAGVALEACALLGGLLGAAAAKVIKEGRVLVRTPPPVEVRWPFGSPTS